MWSAQFLLRLWLGQFPVITYFTTAVTESVADACLWETYAAGPSTNKLVFIQSLGERCQVVSYWYSTCAT